MADNQVNGMSEWTQERLEQMIADGVEENHWLDYKRADALGNTDKKKAEITKDVSAFANSDGGVLIYGIAESEEPAKSHLPERLDPVRRSDISKEWLEQVIQVIQPPIEGVVIYPVTIDEPAGRVCYVVIVPQSHTAHQARNRVYYKRHNFNSLPMADFEVREAMNRKTHPKIRAAIFINTRAGGHKPEGVILVKIENVGHVLVRNVMVELELPIDLDSRVSPDGDVTLLNNDEGDGYLLRLDQGLKKTPIFPHSYLVLERKIHTHVKVVLHDRSPVVSTRHVKISVFAEDMPPLKAVLGIAPVIKDWTLIEPQTAP